MIVANIGTYPELEKKLFCGGCLAAQHGKVLSYNHTGILEGIEDGSYQFSGLCAHCSSPIATLQDVTDAVAGLAEPPEASAAVPASPKPDAGGSGATRRTRTAEPSA